MAGIRADKILFLSETRGIAIPKDFAKQVCENAIVDYEKWKEKLESLADMYSEYYWDTWEDVCQNMIIEDMYHSYKRYTLHQDGDLWLQPHKNNVEWVTDKEELSEPDDYWGDPESYEGHYEWKEVKV